MVPKRKRAQCLASEPSGEDYDEDSDGSYYNDTSCPKVIKKTGKTRQSIHRPHKKGHKDDGSTAATGDRILGHSVSMHVITAIEPIRVELLEWYDRVHDVRKMPWRKKFDPSLDIDGRAQRAYEVGPFVLTRNVAQGGLTDS